MASYRKPLTLQETLLILSAEIEDLKCRQDILMEEHYTIMDHIREARNERIAEAESRIQTKTFDST